MYKVAAALSLAMAAAQAQTVELVPVTSSAVQRTIKLPGEFLPFQTVELRAKVAGFVDSVDVDRGTAVRKGQLLVTLTAPEMKTQILEREAKVKALEAGIAEHDAKIASVQSTYEHLKAASATPGAIAGNELEVAEKQVEAAKAAKSATLMSVEAAKAAVAAQRELLDYLQVTAPFEGVITERMAHPGALAGPNEAEPLLRLEQVSRLRLVVAVPEADLGGLVRNGRVPFSVSAYPNQTFYGSIARFSRSLDPKTRTMPVELDVLNAGGKLSPGMYPEVQWPVKMTTASLLVPQTAVVTTTSRTFVIRVGHDNHADWVTVRKGTASGDLIEIYGDLTPGDRVVKSASDEIRNGSAVRTKAAKS